MNYEKFIESKRHTQINHGIKPIWMPDNLFDYQYKVAELSILKGRCADFLDTGLGKTILELTVAMNFLKATNKKVLILTPLAVAFQFITEAEKFGIDDIEYSKHGKFTKGIVVCNYERLHLFDSNDFDCVICDESSLLKNSEGATRQLVTSFLKKVKYRYLFTATPSPNDYIELGTSSEALGYLGYTDMLGKFFKNNNDNTVKIGQVAMARQGVEWYLKPHAETSFWQWLSTWSISMRKPSDLGFSDERHILPPLNVVDTIIRNETPLIVGGQSSLFTKVAQGFAEIKAEVRATINQRCEMAVEKAKQHDCSVYWTNLNDEADLIGKLDKSAYEVKGKMSLEEKEEILIGFAKGQIKKLISKSSITSFGLNWQHCNHTVFFPTYSFEQYYQSIRRFWRFGQLRPVTVDRIISDGQTKILASLEVKKDKADSMFTNLTKHANSEFTIDVKKFSKSIQLPNFLK